MEHVAAVPPLLLVLELFSENEREKQKNVSVVVKVVLYAIESSLLSFHHHPMRSRFESSSLTRNTALKNVGRRRRRRRRKRNDRDDDVFLKKKKIIIAKKKKKRTAMDSPSSSPCPRTLLAWNSIDGSCNVFLQIAHESKDVDHDQTATAFHFFTSIFLFG